MAVGSASWSFTEEDFNAITAILQRFLKLFHDVFTRGKTTNLEHVYAKVKPDTRGKLISLATATGRTLVFDVLPVDLGTIRGFKTRFHLYTVPGQVYYTHEDAVRDPVRHPQGREQVGAQDARLMAGA